MGACVCMCVCQHSFGSHKQLLPARFRVEFELCVASCHGIVCLSCMSWDNVSKDHVMG